MILRICHPQIYIRKIFIIHVTIMVEIFVKRLIPSETSSWHFNDYRISFIFIVKDDGEWWQCIICNESTGDSHDNQYKLPSKTEGYSLKIRIRILGKIYKFKGNFQFSIFLQIWVNRKGVIPRSYLLEVVFLSFLYLNHCGVVLSHVRTVNRPLHYS